MKQVVPLIACRASGPRPLGPELKGRSLRPGVSILGRMAQHVSLWRVLSSKDPAIGVFFVWDNEFRFGLHAKPRLSFEREMSSRLSRGIFLLTEE